MKKYKQHTNSLMLAIAVSGIDFMIKQNNNTFMKHFENDMNKAWIYYVLLFIVTFVISEIVYNKIKKFNSRYMK